MKLYDPAEWEMTFKKCDLYKQLANEYDIVYFDKHSFAAKKLDFTPRQWLANQAKFTAFSAIPFYYIEWLQEINPKNVYDLGCGWNIFKKYYPNIIGVGAEDPKELTFQADIHDYVDDDYIQGHQEYFESVFSICALHFIPLSDMRKRVLDFASMIKPGGRGWLSLNAMRMIEKDPIFKNTDLDNKESFLAINDFCKQELSNLPNVVCLDIDLRKINEYMDGNIQIQFDKGT
jgi:hypothetical protein